MLLVVTDGIDNASVVNSRRIEKQAEERETVIFAVGLYGDAQRAARGRHELDQLADRTGGVAYYPATSEMIGSIALEIARQIRSQYTIGYTPHSHAVFDHLLNNARPPAVHPRAPNTAVRALDR